MIKVISFNRDTKDFDMFPDGEYQGSRANYHEAEVALDAIVFDALSHDAGPVEMAVEGALERLALESSQHAQTAESKTDRAYFRRAATAYTNALLQYRAGVRPEVLASGAHILPSRRAGEPPHIVTMDGDWVWVETPSSALRI